MGNATSHGVRNLAFHNVPGRHHAEPGLQSSPTGTATITRSNTSARHAPHSSVSIYLEYVYLEYITTRARSAGKMIRLRTDRGIAAVIPGPADQIGHRKRRGTTGGRPPAFDKEDYKGRNVVDRLQYLQAVARARHPLRQARPHLPGRRGPPRHQHLADSIRRRALVLQSRL